jgi:hypothetical protein
MKKLFFLLIFIVTISYVQGQWCVKTYPTGGTPILSIGSNITVLEIAQNGDIWFNMLYGSGLGWGLGKFTGEEWVSFYPGSGSDIPHSVVNAIDFDNYDSIWVATENGLARFDGINQKGWEIYQYPIMTDNRVSALKIDLENTKWVGLANGDILTLNKGNWTIYNKYHSQGKINDIEVGLDGSIWVAKDGIPGLIKYLDGNWTPFEPFADIKYITCDQFGRTFVSSGDSLSIIVGDKITNIIKADPRLNATLFDVAIGPYGGVWVSSNKGLLLKAGDFFRKYNQGNSAIPLLFSPIPLEFDPEGNLWFSYYYILDKNAYPGLGYLYQSKIITTPISILNKPKPEFCYGDSIVLDVPVDANTYVWSNGSISKTTAIYENAIVDVAYEGANSCYYYDTIHVVAQHVFEDEKIGVVTCDPVINRNLVVWKKTPDKGTEYYNVYKMLSLDDSVYLGSVNYNELTVFTDTTSNPKVQSTRYVITVVDTCGNESYLSSVHKTMHLAASPGTGNEVNLIWEHYEGIPVYWYYIYRGTDSTAMELIDSVDFYSGKTQYTDYNSPAYKVYYQIAIKLPEPIILSTGKKADSGPYSQSMSNLEDNRFLASVNNLKLMEVLSYPNPFSDWTQIDFDNPMKYPYQLIITDMSGKIVKTVKDIRGNRVVVLRENLPQGFYLFELKGETVYRGKFIIE